MKNQHDEWNLSKTSAKKKKKRKKQPGILQLISRTFINNKTARTQANENIMYKCTKKILNQGLAH